MFKCEKIYFSDFIDASDVLMSMRMSFKNIKIKYYTSYLKILSFVLLIMLALAYLNVFIPNRAGLVGIVILTVLGHYIGSFRVRVLFRNIELNIELFMMYLTVLAHKENYYEQSALKNEYRRCIDDYIDLMEDCNVDFTAIIPVLTEEEVA